VTSGPGGIHLLNGLYDAKLDGVPVLAITGLQFHETQQDVEFDKLFMNVASWAARLSWRTRWSSSSDYGQTRQGDRLMQRCSRYWVEPHEWICLGIAEHRRTGAVG
jgi:Thiamine pyrophosphate enzyme, N-terminal TPP binding domain